LMVSTCRNTSYQETKNLWLTKTTIYKLKKQKRSQK